MISKIVAGPHLLVYINGQIFGIATSLQWSSQTPRSARMGLDGVMPYEISPTTSKLSGRMSCFRSHGDGGVEGYGIVAPAHHIAREKYFSILVINRITGAKIFQADHCSVTEQSWSYAARRLIEGNFSFDGIDQTGDAIYP